MPMTLTRRDGVYTPRRQRETTHAEAQPLPAGMAVGTLAHFKWWAGRELKLDDAAGSAFPVEPFQEEALTDYFAGVKETLILLPSGNGKTTLIAALVLYHVCHTRNPNVFIMASSRKQAGRLLEHAKGFIDRNPRLALRLYAKEREITLRGRTGFVEALGADEDTADGIGPTLAIIDEYHRHKHTGLYDVALKGLKKRRGQLVNISTAGESEKSPLGLLRKRGLSLPNLIRTGMHNYSREGDDFAFHEWALDRRHDDAHDIDVVKMANPLSTITVADLRAEYKSMKWWSWARFACGLWVKGETAAISPIDWSDCQYDVVEFDAAFQQFLAIDLAWIQDTTAITAIQARSLTDVRLKVVDIIEPPGDGTALREERILSPVRDYKRDNPNLAGVILDPEAGGRSLIEKFNDMGLEVIEHSQKNEPMCDAFGKLDWAIRTRVNDTEDSEEEDPTRVLRVETHQELTNHMLSAELQTFPDKRSKLVKRRKDPEWIDGAVSSAMGVRVALAELEPPAPVARPLVRVIA